MFCKVPIDVISICCLSPISVGFLTQPVLCIIMIALLFSCRVCHHCKLVDSTILICGGISCCICCTCNISCKIIAVILTVSIWLPDFYNPAPFVKNIFCVVSFPICNTCDISKCIITVFLAGFPLCRDFCPSTTQVIRYICTIPCCILCMDKVPLHIIGIALLYCSICTDDCKNVSLCVISIL